MQKHPGQMRVRQFVPALFVSVLFFSLLLAPFSIWMLALVAGSYLIGSLGASLAAGKGNWRLLPLLPVVFVTLHLAYGIGFLSGLVAFWNRWESRQDPLSNSQVQVQGAE